MASKPTHCLLLTSPSDPMAPQRPIYPLYNTSWTLHRLSPLYHGKFGLTLLDNPGLISNYSRRLRDVLKGDILRGVQVGLTATALDGHQSLVKAGVLKDCIWTVLERETAWAQNQRREDDDNDDSGLFETLSTAATPRGILITLLYEHATYKTILLRSEPQNDQQPSSSLPGFTHIPLLLTRLPASLRQTILDFLSTTFDTRISPLTLSSTLLFTSFESYISALSLSPPDMSSFVDDVIKDVQIRVSFAPPIAPALKTLEIKIEREDLWQFLPHTPASSSSATTSSFTTLLHAHLTTHLRLDFIQQLHDTNNVVRISKISCGAFVLGEEGRVKFIRKSATAPTAADSDNDGNGELEKRISNANEGLVDALMTRAET